MKRQSFRRSAITAVVVLLPFAAHATWDQIEASRFARYVSDLQTKGEPVDLRAGQQPLTTASERRASRLYGAAALLAGDGIPPLNSESSTHAADRHRELVRAEQELEALNDISTEDARLSSLQSVVSGSQTPLELLDAAAALDFNRFDPGSPEYSYQFSNLIHLGELDQVRTDLASFRGDGNAAADSLLSGVRLRRALQAVGNNFAAGTFGSLRLLVARTQPDSDRLSALQSAYHEFATDDGLVRYITGLRARLIGDVWETSSRPFFAQRIHSMWRGDVPTGVEFVVLRPWMTHRLLGTLRELDTALEQARRPWPDKLDMERNGEAPTSATRSTERMSFIVRMMNANGVPVWPDAAVEILGPALGRVAARLAQNRVAVAVLAAERWRRSHGGATPPSLESLVPAEVTAVPIDPFDGQPLRFKVLPDAYVIYSIGGDRHDDGGVLAKWTPDLSGAFPRASDPDIGVRVPLTAVPRLRARSGAHEAGH